MGDTWNNLTIKSNIKEILENSGFEEEQVSISTTEGKIEFIVYESKFWKRKTRIGSFVLSDFPNCSKIAISINTRVEEKYRGKGMAQKMMNIKLKLVKLLEYLEVMATVNIENSAQIHILEKYGWKKIKEFSNPMYRNTVAIYMYDVK